MNIFYIECSKCVLRCPSTMAENERDFTWRVWTSVNREALSLPWRVKLHRAVKRCLSIPALQSPTPSPPPHTTTVSIMTAISLLFLWRMGRTIGKRSVPIRCHSIFCIYKQVVKGEGVIYTLLGMHFGTFVIQKWRIFAFSHMYSFF